MRLSNSFNPNKKTNNSLKPCKTRHSCKNTTMRHSTDWLKHSMIGKLKTSNQTPYLKKNLQSKTKDVLLCKKNWWKRVQNNPFFSRRNIIKAKNTPYASSSTAKVSLLPTSASTTWRGATSTRRQGTPTLTCMSVRFAISRSSSFATSRVTFACTWVRSPTNAQIVARASQHAATASTISRQVSAQENLVLTLTLKFTKKVIELLNQ